MLAKNPLIKNLLTSDAPLGTGLDKNVFSAQTTGSSMLKVFVCLSLTNAPPSTSLELAFLATRDTDLLPEDASWLLKKNPQISAVELGTGLEKNA